jgi:pyruvate, water dikinase
MGNYIKHFSEITIHDISSVGGKNASLGEMYTALTSKGVTVPEGFAVTSAGYWLFLNENKFAPKLAELLSRLDTATFANLSDIGNQARSLILSGSFPTALRVPIMEAYTQLLHSVGTEKTVAVRSSATAEDLPNASFAGQQETYLNVKGEENLIAACHRCYASLFTDRAIKYRADNGFDDMKVALSIGIQAMIRSDMASSGVMFTMDPDSGFEDAVLVSGAWGLGENVVQGSINTDEFLVFKPLLDKVVQPIIARKLGSKIKTMTYSSVNARDIVKPEDAVINLDTSPEKREQYVLTDREVVQLAKWACIIQQHYKCHMDIEWAKDGEGGKIYIVQARPETTHRNKKVSEFRQYTLIGKGKALCSGAGLGNKIVSGKARILSSPSEISKLNEGEILVTERTDPDWDPIMKKAAAIITDQGGRTSHAAIVAREVGVIAVVGTGSGTKSIADGQTITVSTAKGTTGVVYDGLLTWDEKVIDITAVPKIETKAMLILAHPDEAFRLCQLPNDGVGLMRMEFIISNTIGIHPMALKHFDELDDTAVKDKVESMTHLYKNKEDFFVQKMAEATGKIAAAFYPKDVIVRMSDFKSNEYANLIGGKQFEPDEENPMIGFRGASRYYHPLYQEAFEMECKAMKWVRNEMGLTNVKLMIPFCRTIGEAKSVIEVMRKCGLNRNENGLELYVMIEIPSNALLAEEFAQHFDGFSIGSNDLTQLTLGADRDSELLSEIFSPFDPAVMQLIEMTLTKAKKTKTHTGLCGQAPSDYPEYAQFLVKNGIDSISFTPDALINGIENIAAAEKQPAHLSALPSE